MATTLPTAFRRIPEAAEFFERVSDGAPVEVAAGAVGWSPRDLQRRMTDPVFFDLVEAAKMLADGTVQEALFKLAKSGHLGAIQMWLYNRQPELWKDVKRIEVHTDSKVSVSVVHAVKTGAIELLREQGVLEMQKLTAIEAAAHDGS